MVCVAAAPVTASASLIYDAAILLSAQGFGTAPRDLTVQRMGETTSPESGCVAVGVGGAIVVGSSGCLPSEAVVFMANGQLNIGGDEPEPTDDNQKYGIPFETERGIDSADDIGILFNATEPNGDQINVIDLTLKFYLNGALIGAIDGNQDFASSNPGNGVAGFVFRVAADQQAYVNGLLAQGNIQFALESTLTGSSGGPESYRIVNLNEPVITTPEPGSLALLGMGLLCCASRLRRRRQ